MTTNHFQLICPTLPEYLQIVYQYICPTSLVTFPESSYFKISNPDKLFLKPYAQNLALPELLPLLS